MSVPLEEQIAYMARRDESIKYGLYPVASISTEAAILASLRRVKELEADAQRLDWLAQLQPWDELCGIDIHKKASDFAAAAGRDEPLPADYTAALRFQIDFAMKGGTNAC